MFQQIEYTDTVFHLDQEHWILLLPLYKLRNPYHIEKYKEGVGLDVTKGTFQSH